jgi:hypothetical protein
METHVSIIEYELFIFLKLSVLYENKQLLVKLLRMEDM